MNIRRMNRDLRYGLKLTHVILNLNGAAGIFLEGFIGWSEYRQRAQLQI